MMFAVGLICFLVGFSIGELVGFLVAKSREDY